MTSDELRKSLVRPLGGKRFSQPLGITFPTSGNCISQSLGIALPSYWEISFPNGVNANAASLKC